MCHSPDLSVVRELVHYLQSNIPGLREQALQSLGRIAPFLPDEVKKGKDAQGRPVQEAVAALIECLKVREHRGPAAHVLMYLGPDAADRFLALIDAINHADNQADSAIHHSRVQSDSGPGRHWARRQRSNQDSGLAPANRPRLCRPPVRRGGPGADRSPGGRGRSRAAPGPQGQGSAGPRSCRRPLD